MKKTTYIIACAFLVLLSACGGSEDLGRGKTGKSMVVEGKSYNQIWDASIKAVKQSRGTQALEVEKNLNITKEDKATGIINASTGMSMLSWGEVVGIYISPPANAKVHTVEVESLSKLKTNVFANNWEDELLSSIRKNLSVK